MSNPSQPDFPAGTPSLEQQAAQLAALQAQAAAMAAQAEEAAAALAAAQAALAAQDTGAGDAEEAAGVALGVAVGGAIVGGETAGAVVGGETAGASAGAGGVDEVAEAIGRIEIQRATITSELRQTVDATKRAQLAQQLTMLDREESHLRSQAANQAAAPDQVASAQVAPSQAASAQAAPHVAGVAQDASPSSTDEPSLAPAGDAPGVAAGEAVHAGVAPVSHAGFGSPFRDDVDPFVHMAPRSVPVGPMTLANEPIAPVEASAKPGTQPAPEPVVAPGQSAAFATIEQHAPVQMPEAETPAPKPAPQASAQTQAVIAAASASLGTPADEPVAVAPTPAQFEHGFGSQTFTAPTVYATKKSSKRGMSPVLIGGLVGVGLLVVFGGMYALTSSLFGVETPPTRPPVIVQTTMPIVTDEPTASPTPTTSGSPTPSSSASPSASPSASASASSSTKPKPSASASDNASPDPNKPAGAVTTVLDKNGVKVTAQTLQVATITEAYNIKAQYGDAYARSNSEGNIYLPAGVKPEDVTLYDMSDDKVDAKKYNVAYHTVSSVAITGSVDTYVAYKDTTLWSTSKELRGGQLRYFVIGEDSKEDNQIMVKSESIILPRP